MLRAGLHSGRRFAIVVDNYHDGDGGGDDGGDDSGYDNGPDDGGGGDGYDDVTTYRIKTCKSQVLTLRN